MFEIGDVTDRVRVAASLPHSVALLSPHAFEIRPQGLAPGQPGYQVVVERVAFGLRARVETDVLAVGLRSAVISGIRNRPSRLDDARERLAAAGWTAVFDLGDGVFALGASVDSLPTNDEALADTAVAAAVIFSELVLDQLIVTRLGEMRPAAERNISTEDDDHDPWLYDPSNLERSTRRHRALENWLISQLRERGIEPLDPVSEPLFDLGWRVRDVLFVCEVKTLGLSTDKQLRLGLGQVLHYAKVLESTVTKVVPCLFVEHEPESLWVRLAEVHGVSLVWPETWDRFISHVMSSA